MKKITLLTALLFSAILSAQVTYTSADYAAVGEEVTLSKAPTILQGLFNFAATGANYNWNFSGLTADSQTTFSYQNPNNAGYKISWCFSNGYLFNCNSQFNSNFTHATQLSEGFEIQEYGITNVIEHSKLSGTALETKMVGMSVGIGTLALPVAVDYESPDVIYQFPMNYNDSYTNNGAFSLDLSNMGFPVQYDSQISRTNTVQGWGSLVTPFMTFPNVLKMKTVLERVDTITFNGIEIPVPTTTVSYKWFDKNYGLPVLQADGTEIAGIFIPLSVTYIDGPQCLPPAAQFNLIPFGTDYNPQTQSAEVAFANLSTNFETASWDFGDGTTGTAMNPTHAYTCPGTYEVTLTIQNNFCNPAQTNAITVPIEITDTQNAFTTEVILEATTLTAQRTLNGTTYQWVDCNNDNAPIGGAVAQSYSPSVSGNYACLLTTNGCEALSDCVAVELLSNSEFSAGPALVLYPNPTTGKLQLGDSSIQVRKTAVYNAVGMLVGNTLDLTEQSSGLYFVKITTDAGTFTSKVIKQ